MFLFKYRKIENSWINIDKVQLKQICKKFIKILSIFKNLKYKNILINKIEILFKKYFQDSTI